MSAQLWKKSTPLLDERPPTAEELAWWRTACRPFRRRVMLLNGLLFGLGLAVLPAVVRDWRHFLHGGWMVALPLGVATSVAMGWFQWRMQSRHHLQSELAGKRMRERLHAELALEAHEQRVEAARQAALTAPE